MTPAAMYFLATLTMRSYSADGVLDDGQTESGPFCTRGGEWASGASSASTTAASRLHARSNAVSAEMPASGRTGVTMVMMSVTASKTTTAVGRSNMASGTPIGSG